LGYEFAQVAVRTGGVAAQTSETVGVMTGGGEQHSTVTGGGHVTTGGGAVMAMVSLQHAELPAWSVAVQTTTMPLLPKSALTETLPSALTVQPVAPAGQAQVGAIVPSQISLAVAETVTGPELHCDEAAEMAHVIDGGVVSTTVSELVQDAVRPVDEVAVQVTCAPLFAYTLGT